MCAHRGPLGRSLEDKFTFGFFERGPGRASGVLDLDRGYRVPDERYLGLLLLEPALPGRRLGTAIVDATLEWLRAEGARSVRLVVAEQNVAARRFWERFGLVADRTFPSRRQGRREVVLTEFQRVPLGVCAPRSTDVGIEIPCGAGFVSPSRLFHMYFTCISRVFVRTTKAKGPTGMRDRTWFEMKDIRRRRLSDAVWVPLRAIVKESSGAHGHVGFEEDFFAIGSVAFGLSHRNVADSLGWSDIGIGHDQRPYVLPTGYKTVDTFQEPEGIDIGIDLVLDQGFDGAADPVWHLHQDLVVALGLLREGDNWLCPQEGFLEVAHLKRNADGTPRLLEIRSEHLRDYLAARGMALRLSTFRSRVAVGENEATTNWAASPLSEGDAHDRFEIRRVEIHEGGEFFGSTAAVFHLSRTDVDEEADVPTFDLPAEEHTRHRSWSLKPTGRKLYEVFAEMWRNEWIEPAGASARVRRDKIPSACSFIVDASGQRESADVLNDQDVGRYLWFRPEIIRSLCERRGGSLRWYTRDTGGVAALPGHEIHFGVNSKDLVTAYAYDIASLPEWLRQLCVGFNVSPDGGVGDELLAAQQRAEPAATTSPEEAFVTALARIDKACKQRWGVALLNSHAELPQILRRVHRFRALDVSGFLELAKDVARLTADSIDIGPLQKIVPLSKGEKRGSLKSLERALSTVVSPENAHELMGPLFGAYDLRLGDAHLPSSQIDHAFTLARVDRSVSFLRQAMQLLANVAEALNGIAAVVESNIAGTAVPGQNADDT